MESDTNLPSDRAMLASLPTSLVIHNLSLRMQIGINHTEISLSPLYFIIACYESHLAQRRAKGSKA
jgi:hypothetical protein